MAAEGIFQEIGGKIVERIFSGLLWFGVAIILIVVVGGLMWYFFVYSRKFDILVKIKSNRSEDKYSVIFDKAAILTDIKTQTPYFRIWDLKRDFPVPKYNVLQQTNKGDYLEIFRKSQEEFYFLTESKIDKTKLIKEDGKVYAFAQESQIMVDPDLAFWSVKRKDQNKRMFSSDSFLMKLLPYIPHILAGVIIIFILYILLDHLPGILSQLRDLTEAMTRMQKADVVIG